MVFIPAFRRFIYSSWSECTFEFYESPTPWGPWRHFLTNDFGPPPWIGPRVQALAKQGGYAPTIPSKFISADGRSSWVQSNWFGGAATYTGNTYHFSLRSLRLDPMPPDPGQSTVDGPAAGNLARANGARPFGSAVRCGQIGVLNDERVDRAEDSWNGRQSRDEHYWGYTWPEPQRIERVVYTTGQHDYTGGWFTQPPRVQVRRGACWVDVAQLTTTPSYPCDYTATGTKRFTLRFNATTSTGLRLIGPPGRFGGPYTSIAELEVYGGPNGQEAP